MHFKRYLFETPQRISNCICGEIKEYAIAHLRENIFSFNIYAKKEQKYVKYAMMSRLL